MSVQPSHVRVVLFWLVNALGVLAAIVASSVLNDWFKSIVISMLATMFLNGINWYLEMRDLSTEVKKVLLTKEIEASLTSLGDQRTAKKEFLEAASCLSKIGDKLVHGREHLPAYFCDLA